MSKYRKNRNTYRYDDSFNEKDYDSELDQNEYDGAEPEEENPSEGYADAVTDEESESGEAYAEMDGGDPEPAKEEEAVEEADVPSGEEASDEEASEADYPTDEAYPEDGEDRPENEDYPEDDVDYAEGEEDPEAEAGYAEEDYPENEEYPGGEEGVSDSGADYPTDGDYPEAEAGYAEEDYPEDEDYPDEEEEYLDDAEIRRRARRKRRIRNQMLAYLLLAVLLICIAACGFLAVRKVVSKINGKKEQQKIDEQIEALAESEEEIVIEAPKVKEEEEEMEEVDYLSEIVDACISEMPIEDKIAQLFIVTPESVTGANAVTQAGEKTKEALEKYAVGGFIYFGGNIVDREQLTNMISTTDGYRKYRMFFAVDEEGGTCSRVSSSKIEVPDVGPMGAIGEAGVPAKAFEAGQTIGTYLKEFGFNVDFAPVADIVTVPEGSAIGNRSFGSNPQLVGEMVANCVKGIQESGISACLKHFPGLGDTTEDTHEGRAVITKTLDELQNANFESFRAGIDAGADFIMVSHATAENADDSALPCSMSKNMIKGQLRDYLGYDGIVITDALNMKAVTDYFTTEEICVKAFKAGVDILLMPDDFEKAYNALLEAVNDGSISEDRVDESLRRIFRVKFKNDMTQ